MMYNPRIIEGLKSVSEMSRPPGFASGKRTKYIVVKGLAFERQVKRELIKLFPDLIVGQWLTFHDVNGTGYAQPDMYAVTEKGVFLFECKTRETPKAFWQLLNLYKPLLEHMYGRRVYVLQIVKQATDRKSVHITPEKLFAEPKLDYYVYIAR